VKKPTGVIVVVVISLKCPGILHVIIRQFAPPFSPAESVLLTHSWLNEESRYCAYQEEEGELVFSCHLNKAVFLEAVKAFSGLCLEIVSKLLIEAEGYFPVAVF